MLAHICEEDVHGKSLGVCDNVKCSLFAASSRSPQCSVHCRVSKCGVWQVGKEDPSISAPIVPSRWSWSKEMISGTRTVRADRIGRHDIKNARGRFSLWGTHTDGLPMADGSATTSKIDNNESG
jgi:hypothetical protein